MYGANCGCDNAMGEMRESVGKELKVVVGRREESATMDDYEWWAIGV